MKFRTEIKVVESEIRLGAFEPVMMIGSCFADNMASRMRRTLWPAYNPFGMLYNPLSIHNTLENLLLLPETGAIDAFRDSILCTGGIFVSRMFDSRMHGATADALMRKYLDLRREVRERMDHIRTVFVTFGTAWCYAPAEVYDYDNPLSDIVANCHKLPAGMFRRFRLTPEEISHRWECLVNRLRQNYPDLRFVFTVSPVRHLKDGIHENTLSKAILHLSIEQLCRTLPQCCYFPAFELLIDDLRDYRFYADDMAHPSPQAVEYIWEHFRHTFLTPAAQQAADRGESLYKRLNHRPITGVPDPAFIAETRRLLDEFRNEFPCAICSNALCSGVASELGYCRPRQDCTAYRDNPVHRTETAPKGQNVSDDM